MEPLLRDTMQYFKKEKPTEYTARCLWWGELIENIESDVVKAIVTNIFLDAVK